MGVDPHSFVPNSRDGGIFCQHTVYECPTCDTRSVGDQRCTECNTFMRRLGPGGTCPECDAVVLLTDLLRDEAVVLH
jgi:hypothetical protein